MISCLLPPLKLSVCHIYLSSPLTRLSRYHQDIHLQIDVGERELGGAAAGRSAPGGGGGSGGVARRDGPHANVAVAIDEAVGEAVGEACITRSGIEGSVAPIEGC